MNMKIAARIAFILATSSVMSGCVVMNAMTDENTVAEKTAKYFGARRESIVISAIDKGALETNYKAKYAGKSYNCFIYYGEVECKQPGAQSGRDDIGGGRQVVPAVANDNAMTPAQAQARLNKLGYPVGSPDGVFGKKSIEKLKLFQQSRGLTANGKLDEPTIEALR